MSGVKNIYFPAYISTFPIRPPFPAHLRPAVLFPNNIRTPFGINGVHTLPCGPVEHLLRGSVRSPFTEPVDAFDVAAVQQDHVNATYLKCRWASQDFARDCRTRDARVFV